MFHYQRIIFLLLSIYCLCFLCLYFFSCLLCYLLKKVFQSFHINNGFIRLIFSNFGGEQRCCFKMSTCSRTTQKLHPTLKPPIQRISAVLRILGCGSDVFTDYQERLNRSGKLKNHSFSPNFLNIFLNFHGCLKKIKFPNNKGPFSGKSPKLFSLPNLRESLYQKTNKQKPFIPGLANCANSIMMRNIFLKVFWVSFSVLKLLGVSHCLLLGTFSGQNSGTPSRVSSVVPISTNY